MHFLPIFVYVCFAFQSNMFWINEVSLLWFIQCSFNHLKKPNAICIHFLRSFSILCAIFAHEKRKIQKQPTDEPKTKASGEESNALYSKLSFIGAKNWKSISIEHIVIIVILYLYIYIYTNTQIATYFFYFSAASELFFCWLYVMCMYMLRCIFIYSATLLNNY